MKRLASIALCVSLASAGLLGSTGSTFAAPAPASSAVGSATETFKQRAERSISDAAVSEAVKATFRAVVAELPDDADQRVARLNAKLGIKDTQWAGIAGSVINPADYQCDTTPLQTWVRGTVANWGFSELFVLTWLPLLDLATYDALLFGTESKANTFGIDGQYTSLLTSQMKDLRAFWDIQGNDIQLVPMHGADLYKDADRLARLLGVLFGLTPDSALNVARMIIELMDLVPGFQGGAHPLFTLNAFAFDPSDEPAFVAFGMTKSIVMGDGILQGFAAIGIDEKVGPRAILAHEYGHQVQFAKKLFESTLTGAEATRRTELMADGLGTYFMVHSKGEALNATRTLADQKTFYNVGDCGFASDGHHGTPNQRYTTSGWAVSVVNSAADQGHQLGSVEFQTRFDAKHAELVAPDAG